MRINKILWPSIALLAGLNSQVSVAKSYDDNDETLVVVATAEQVLKQQPGVSIITSEDIKDPSGQRPLRYYSQNAVSI